jgi:putative nucleotidyltransferase with HDIG domain
MNRPDNLPDIANCFRLMEEYAMLPNIRRHSIMVARVALLILDGLSQNRTIQPFLPDRPLVAAGALLHDIAKTPCLHNDGDHARVGGEICDRLGFPEIARIVEEHVLLRNHDDERRRRGEFSARELIYYADKRVRHEEVVSLDERLDYIVERYGGGEAEIERRIRENFVRCVQLEYFLFSFLPFSPADLAQLVRNYGGENLAGEMFPAEGMTYPGREQETGQVGSGLIDSMVRG